MDRRKLIEYYKQILDRFSTVEPVLFRKELRKAFQRLDQTERAALKKWFRSSCVCKVDQSEKLIGIPIPSDQGKRLS